jgi:5'-3' exonuclease
MGVVVWPMVELEADDALGAAARLAAADPAVERVLVCSPDKDLAQCVVGDRVVQFDRRNRKLTDEAGVVEKFGVLPASIPDYLGLVGDSADGYPGLPGWGARSAGAILSRFGHIESIPADPSAWGLALRGADRLSRTLEEQRELALLCRDLATLRSDWPAFESLSELRWSGPTPAFEAVSIELEQPQLWQRVIALKR